MKLEMRSFVKAWIAAETAAKAEHGVQTRRSNQQIHGCPTIVAVRLTNLVDSSEWKPSHTRRPSSIINVFQISNPVFGWRHWTWIS